MAFEPTVPLYTRYEHAMSDIITLAGQVLAQAQNENPGVSVIVRQATASDWNYTSPSALFSLAASSISTVVISNFTVGTGQVIAPFGIVVTNLPSGVILEYMDVYVGGQRVARYDLSILNRHVSGDDASVIYIPAEYSVIVTQNQSLYIDLVAYNTNTVAVNVGIELLGLVGEQNGKTISIKV